MLIRPILVKSNNWITAVAIVLLVLLKVEDDTEAITLKARGYLSSHLSKKKVAKLIEKAFLKLKFLVPGLEGKEHLFMRQQLKPPSWKQRLGELVLRGAIKAVFSNMIDYLFSL
jgi:hypothetical protein